MKKIDETMDRYLTEGVIVIEFDRQLFTHEKGEDAYIKATEKLAGTLEKANVTYTESSPKYGWLLKIPGGDEKKLQDLVKKTLGKQEYYVNVYEK